MEAVGVLHQQGHGLLKLYCYVKEGLGRWTFFVYASDQLARSVSAAHLPRNYMSGAVMGYEPFGCVETVEDVIALFRRDPALLDQAKGDDPVYVAWYAGMLKNSAPNGYLEMETPDTAFISGKQIATPVLSGTENS